MISRTPATGRSTQARWTAVVAGGVAVLSFEGVIVRSLDLDQWTILLLRGPLMAAGLALLFRLGGGRGGPLAGLRAAGGLGLAAAGLFAADNLLFIIALRNSSVANTLVLLATAPVFAGVLGRLVLGERPPARTWVATAVVLCGVGVIVSGDLGHRHLLGDLAALGAALSIAGTLVLIRLGRAVVMLPSMALGALGAALVAAPLADPGSVAGHDALLLVLVGLVIAPLAFGAISVGPRHLPAQEVSLLMLLETVLGPLWAWLLLGQAPMAATLGGGALIVAALLAHALLGMRRPPPAVAEPPPDRRAGG
jgi:drug/metabolite transporter (DMT)-like permease